jgi:hypothetical protein
MDLHTFGQSFLGPSFLIKVERTVDPVNSFVVPSIVTAQGFKAFPESPARMLFDQDIQGLDDFGITIMPLRCSIIGRPRQADA